MIITVHSDSFLPIPVEHGNVESLLRVCDALPATNQHWVNVSCSLGGHTLMIPTSSRCSSLSLLSPLRRGSGLGKDRGLLLKCAEKNQDNREFIIVIL